MKQRLLFISLLVLVGCGSQDKPNSTSTNPSAPVKANEPAAPAEAHAPLDLSRQYIEDLAEQDIDLSDPEPLMPDLLSEASDPKRVKLGGSLITNKEAQMLKDKVDGVEFKIEVATP